MLVKPNFVENLCTCGPKCLNFKQQISEQVEAVEKVDESEEELGIALEANPLSEAEDLYGELSLTLQSNKASDSTELFTERSTTDYPHVTPLFKAQVTQGINKMLSGMMKHHIQTSGPNEKDVTADHIQEWFEKFHKGEIKPKTPKKKD
mmetsp:Transcript_32034/g.28397  ORF Transcript_32034/g.28397 Transcript_32034/m.28397 type:complete len:149 (+) Transcript_32034:345-791(+)